MSETPEQRRARHVRGYLMLFVGWVVVIVAAIVFLVAGGGVR